MRLFWVCAIGLVTTCAFLVLVLARSVPTPLDDPDAYAVIDTFLPDHWLVVHGKATRLLFVRETTTDRTCMPASPALEAEWKPVFEHFKIENSRMRTLQPGHKLRVPYIVMPGIEIARALKGTPPTGQISDRFPASVGLIGVSAVGFDHSKTRAMVYMMYYCAGLCAAGGYHFLDKQDGIWRETFPGLERSCNRVS